MTIFLISMMACESVTSKTPPEEESTLEWSLIDAQIGPGVLLSAWSDSDEVLMVGGALYGQGDGILVRYRPDENWMCWESLAEDRTLWWIHGDGNGEWWSVGDAGTIIHHQDGVLTREDVDTEATLYGVWMDGDTVWAVGGDISTSAGEIWRRSDGSWGLFTSGLSGIVFKVWDRFFVGDNLAYVLEGDTANDLVLYPPDSRLVTIRGESMDNAWAVGGQLSAEIRHWENGAWSEVDTQGLSLPLNGVWTAPGETVWVAGMSGTQGYLEDDGTWEIPEFPLTSDHFHAVWKHNDEVLFLGGNFLATAPPYWGTISRYGEAKPQPEIEACQ